MESRGRFTIGHCAPGAELFRSDRRFHLVAHTISHGTTLVRSWENGDGTRAATRIDLAFQTTHFLKLRRDYDGITIRVPAESDLESLGREVGAPSDRLHDRPLLVQSRGITDFVAASGFAWVEDCGDPFGPGAFAGPADFDSPPWARALLMGVDGGVFATASPDQLNAALADPEAGPRQQYRYVWILMRRFHGHDDPRGHSVGAFLTFEEAEDELRRQIADSPNDEWWIDTAPIAV
jgi:hypothetical protein